MSLDRSAADAALKEDYQPAIREQLNNNVMLLAQIEQNTKDIEGKRAVLSLHVSRNSGVGARSESGTLPTAGNQGYVEERVPVKYNYGTFKVTGPVIKSMRSDTGSFTRAVASESKGIVDDLKRDVNRQAYTNENGSIGVSAGAAPSAVTLTLSDITEVRRLELDGYYDLYDSDGTTLNHPGIQVSDVNTTTLVVTFSALDSAGAAVDLQTSPTTAASDFLVNTGVVPANNEEIIGLEQIVDSSGTLHNVNSSTTPRWKSTEIAASGAPSDTMFEQALDEVQIASGGDIDMIITSFEAVRAFAAGQKTLKRYSADPVKLRGGFDAVTVQVGRGEFTLYAERDCYSTTAFGVTTECLTQYTMSDWEFMDEDGAVLNRVSGVDAYEAVLYKYHELATDARNKHFKITGMTV